MQGVALMEQGVREAMAGIAASPQRRMTPFVLLVDHGKVVRLTSRRDAVDALAFFRQAIRPRPGTTDYVLIWDGVMAEFHPDRPGADGDRAVFAEMGDDRLPDATVMAYRFAIKEPGLFRRKRELMIKDNTLIYAAAPSRIFPGPQAS